MAKKKSLRAEVDVLRAELEALRAERASPEKTVVPETDDVETTREDSDKGAMFPGSTDIEQAISEFVESTKEELAERPAMAVAVAFLLGILIGRLSKT